LQSLPPDELVKAEREGQYDAALTEPVSGPTLLRLYMMWHSNGVLNRGGLRGNATVDAALDRVRNATSDDEYRDGVRAVQQAFVDDPPALFLAWTERARAVSTRFTVIQPAPGRDILGTIGSWTPRNDERTASRN
jgi:ABC-type transport system substrate-binding protein